jgi:hypothetical protein
MEVGEEEEEQAIQTTEVVGEEVGAATLAAEEGAEEAELATPAAEGAEGPP